MSASFTIEATGLDTVQARLDQLIRTMFDMTPLSAAVGATVESQVRKRIQREKTDPKTGVAWAPWSEKYARTRHGGQSLLMSTGALRDSIQFVTHGDEVEVGSNLVYAARHQYGDNGDAGSLGDLVGGIPARPFLGLTPENEVEVRQVVKKFLDEVLDGGHA